MASLVATLWLCWSPVIAQTSPTQAAKPDTISGRVINENGRPLPNARVIARRRGSIQVENTTTSTDREGKFELSGLQPFIYRINVLLQGYAPILRELDNPEADAYRVGDSVTLMLSKGGVITGTVTNQAGEPVVGVNVRALMVRSTRTLPFPYNLLGSADRTDDRGIYRIYGLAEGTYVVWAGGGGALFTQMDPFDSDVPTYAPASTRDTAREITVRAGAETNGVDIQYRGESGHVVSGTAVGPEGDRPIRVVINLVSTGGPDWELQGFQEANDQGFTLQGVDDGDYHIVAMSFLPNAQLMLSAAKEINVRGTDVTGLRLVVRPLAFINGRVVLEETKATECGNKHRPVFTETLISAQTTDPNVLQGTQRVLSTTTNADERGNVSLKNLPPGRYYFTTQHFAQDWYLKSFSFMSGGKPVDAARTWTTLKAGDRLNGLTITLAQGAASLRAQILLSEGETLAENLYVYLVPAEKEASEDPLRFYGATVTADGKVALDNLAPGRYLVLAATDESASPLAKLRSPDETAYRTKLRRQAEAVKAELELKPCQKVADFKVRFRTE